MLMGCRCRCVWERVMVDYVYLGSLGFPYTPYPTTEEERCRILSCLADKIN